VASNPSTATDGAAHRAARRAANVRKARATSPATDAQGLVAFGCECTRDDCERAVSVPLYVYRRLLDAGDQYLVQAGHHAFSRHRTIVTSGLMRIEERVDDGDAVDGA
jgi:hypothetical protein